MTPSDGPTRVYSPEPLIIGPGQALSPAQGFQAPQIVVVQQQAPEPSWLRQHAGQLVAAGGQWIDVRLPSEFEHYRPDGAVNIPLYSLRLKMAALDRNRPYVVCCDTGRRSSACAYILSERGFNARVLKGGLAATEVARK